MNPTKYVILLGWEYWTGEDWTYSYAEAKLYTFEDAKKEVARFNIPLKIVDIKFEGDRSKCLIAPRSKETKELHSYYLGLKEKRG